MHYRFNSSLIIHFDGDTTKSRVRTRLFIIVFRLVRDVVANHKTTRYAGAATKVIQKITLLKYNVGVQAALYAKER